MKIYNFSRVETSPEDIHGMHAAKGILTARGGDSSHARGRGGSVFRLN